MPAIPHDLVGRVFSHLTVLEEVLPRTRPRYWKCLCSCGNLHQAIQNNLVAGNTKSCGCFRITSAKTNNTTHGGRKDTLYRVFTSMHNRCTNPNSGSYIHYGQRGIRVSEEWDNYPAFKEWAERSGYRQGLSIDRIDTNGEYSSSNCRWTTSETQNRNRNKQRNTSSRYIGVSWNTKRSKWVVSIKLTYQRVFLGYFTEEEEAAKARDNYIRANNLSDFVLNFP